jgi:hypothetical protein
MQTCVICNAVQTCVIGTDLCCLEQTLETRVLYCSCTDPFRWNIGIDQVIQHDLMMNIIGVFRVIRRVYNF